MRICVGTRVRALRGAGGKICSCLAAALHTTITISAFGTETQQIRERNERMWKNLVERAEEEKKHGLHPRKLHLFYTIQALAEMEKENAMRANHRESASAPHVAKEPTSSRSVGC